MIIITLSLFFRTKIEGTTKKRSYTEEELKKALDDIKSGRLGTRRAAALYKIPRSTLRNKVHKMNNLDKKVKSINQTTDQKNSKTASRITTKLVNELDKNEETLSKYSQSSRDQSPPVSDSLRELLKKNICSKFESSDKVSSLNNLQNLQQNLELQQLLGNLGNLNGSLNGNSAGNLNSNLINSLSASLINQQSNLLDNNLISNNNLLNETLAILNQQSNLDNLLTLLRLQFQLMKHQDSEKTTLNNRHTQFTQFTTAETAIAGSNSKLKLDNETAFVNNLEESMNSSVLSTNSRTSSALKMNIDNQIESNHNDEENSRNSLEKYERSRMHNLEQQSNDDDEQMSDESNLSLDDQIEKNDLKQKHATTNLNESLNNSLNLTNNQLLFNTFNLSSLTNLANPLNPLSQLGLASLTGNLNNFNLNLQPIIDQNKQQINQQQAGMCFFKMIFDLR